MISGERGKGVRAGLLAATLLAVSVGTALAADAGSLDPSFGSGGVVATQIGPGSTSDAGTGVALQSDGKIVMVGGSDVALGDRDFVVARFNPGGSLDTSFDGDGIVITKLSTGGDHAEDVAIQGDGKIVVVGETPSAENDGDTVVVRYNSDGTLDQSFDGDAGTGNGVVVTDVMSGREDRAEALAVTFDKIVVAGWRETSDADFNDPVLLRYNQSDGKLDTSFDGSSMGNGIVITPVPNSESDFFLDVEVQGDDKIVAAGGADVDTDPDEFNSDFLLARYNGADGTLDSTFDGSAGPGNGLVTTAIGSVDDFVDGLAIQGDDKIAAGGRSRLVSGDEDFAVARYKGTDGTLDDTFDGGVSGNGRFTISMTPSGIEALREVAVDGDGRLVLAGAADTDPSGSIDFDLALARLNGADGGLDTTFSGDGKLVDALAVPPGDDSARDVVLFEDGKILIAGTIDSTSTSSDFLLARLLGEATPFISVDDVTVSEGNSGTTNATFNVTLDSSSTDSVTVDYQTADGTASAPGDYTALSSTPLTFDPGQTSNDVTVAVNGDTEVESDEIFTLGLSNASSNAIIADGSGTGTITSDDGPAGPAGPAQADTDPPNTKIKKRPKNISDDRTPTYKFGSDESGSTFKCKIDRKKFRACRKKKTFHVKPGKHKVKVRAIDAAGNVDPTPAKDRFKVLSAD